MKKLLFISFCLLMSATQAYASERALAYDSISVAYKPESFTQRSLLPIGLLSTSILYNDNYLDKRIVKLGGISQPALKSADILQYSPAAIMYAMKAFGVEGRSDWRRMVTADIGSVVIMNLITRPTKHIVKRERPDGRAFNSYPSGHTATAFMAAQMLHKEYGETLSPWISVAGYGIAATTGIFRVIANRHWCSDVLGGAAIGIFSTELAYELTDLLSGDKGIKRAIIVPDLEDMPRWKFGLYSDYSMQSDVFTSDEYGNPDAKPACSIGIDASWMPWYIGPTFRAGLTQMKWTGSDVIYLSHLGSVNDVYTLGAGVDIDIPVIERITLNGQAIAGYSPKANSYSFFADKERNQPVEWSIPAGMHCYGNLGMTLRTSAFSSVTIHGGIDFYDKVWRSYVLGARFNYTF